MTWFDIHFMVVLELSGYQELHLIIKPYFEIHACLSGEGHHVCLNFHAYKDKLIKQSLTIKNQDSSRSLKLILMARVLGKTSEDC